MGIKNFLHSITSKIENDNTIITSDERTAIQQIADTDLFPIIKIPETSIQKYKKFLFQDWHP